MITTSKTRSTVISLFAFSFFFLMIFFRGRFEGYEKETFFAARALLFGGNIDARIGAIGVFLSIPFALLYEAANRFGFETIRDFMGPISVVFSSALIPFVFYLLNDLLFENRRIAIIQSILLLTGTMIFPYSFIGMEHEVTLLLIVSYCFLVYYHKKSNAKFLILCGIALAGAVLIKSYSILFALPIALYLVNSRRIIKDKKAITLCALTLCVGIGAHFLWNYAIFGNFLRGRYNLSWEFQYDSIVAGLHGFLFSAGKSIFLFNPVLVLAIPGILTFWKKERALCSSAIAGIFIFILFQAPFRFWTDEIWGPRKLLLIVPLALIPAGYVWREIPKMRLWIKIANAGIILASIFVQILGSLYSTGKYLFYLREIKLDALPLMQYMPSLSQVNVHWFFLKAYLYHLMGFTLPVFTYKIESWMRALFTNGRDVVLIGGEITPKEIFYTPDLWYLSKQIPYMWVSVEYKILYLVIIFIGIAISGKTLYERVR